MEISWLGLLFLLVAWACVGVSTGFGFYLYTKQKEYIMDATDKGYLLTASIAAACALAFTTIVALLVVFMGRSQFTSHAETINRLMSEKMDLENKLHTASMTPVDVDGDGDVDVGPSSRRRNILENPIPIRRGRSARPLIV